MSLVQRIRRFFRRLFGIQEKPAKRKTVSEVQFPNALFLPEVVKLLNEGHTVTLSLAGYSMRPFLEHKRDKALLVKPEHPAVGDPILAEIAPGHFVLHRIISIEGDKVTLRGDGNLSCEYCRKENLVGAVEGFYRKGREPKKVLDRKGNEVDKNLDRIDGWKWKTYSWLWTRLYPVRRYLLALYRRIWIPLFGPM